MSRVREFGISLPPAPTWFQKPVSALNAHGGAVVRPANCHYLNYEGEIAIVIGERRATSPSPTPPHYIAGYTIANDFGLHDFRDTDAGSMLRVKGADTLCPLGPGIVTDWDFHSKSMRTLRQRCRPPRRLYRRDGLGHALPRHRHRSTHHARARRRHPVGHARPMSRPVEPGDVVTVEVEGLGDSTEPRRGVARRP